MSDDGDKMFFDNVQLEHVLAELVKGEDLEGTVVNVGTTLTNPMRVRNLT